MLCRMRICDAVATPISSRLWDQLGASLPEDCRYLIYGTPALAHPSGLILAVGIGTQYGLCVPSLSSEAAKESGANKSITWSGGGTMDIRHDYGEDWVFYAWLRIELLWCRAVHDLCQSAA